MWYLVGCGGPAVWAALEASAKQSKPLPKATQEMIERDGPREWRGTYEMDLPVAEPAAKPAAKPAVAGLLAEYRHPRD